MLYSDTLYRIQTLLASRIADAERLGSSTEKLLAIYRELTKALPLEETAAIIMAEMFAAIEEHPQRDVIAAFLTQFEQDFGVKLRAARVKA